MFGLKIHAIKSSLLMVFLGAGILAPAGSLAGEVKTKDLNTELAVEESGRWKYQFSDSNANGATYEMFAPTDGKQITKYYNDKAKEISLTEVAAKGYFQGRGQQIKVKYDDDGSYKRVIWIQFSY